MKYILSAIFLALAITSGWTQDSLHRARARWKVVSETGATGATTFNSTLCGELESVTPEKEFKDVVTTKGKESELRWHFVKQVNRADVYHFTFTRKILGQTKTEEKDVEFGNRRVQIFEDDYHSVVIEPPSNDDLKAWPGR